MLGLVLGAGLAYLANSLDGRLRTADEVAAALNLALLARVPPPPRKERSNAQVAMLSSGSGEYGEAYRKLRTNLDFANLTADASTIMIPAR